MGNETTLSTRDKHTHKLTSIGDRTAVNNEMFDTRPE